MADAPAAKGGCQTPGHAARNLYFPASAAKVAIMDAPEKPSAKGLSLVAGLAIAGLAIIGIVALILNHRNESNRTEFTGNFKKLHLALLDFSSDYGCYPSDELAKEVPAFAGLSGSRVLEQLKVAGCVDDLGRLLAVPEKSGTEWYYFPRASSSDYSTSPVLVSPVVDGSRVALRIDGSARPEDNHRRWDTTGAIAIPVVQR